MTSKNRLSRVVSFTISATVSFVFLYLAFQGLDWKSFFGSLSQIKPVLVCLVFVTQAISFVFRSFRWKNLCQQEGQIIFKLALFSNAAGYLGNNIFPARAGEFIRSYLMGKRSGIGFSFALANAFVERILDTVFLIIICVIALLSFKPLPGAVTNASLVFGIVALVGLVAIFVVPYYSQIFVRLIKFLPIRITWKTRLEIIFERFILGMQTLRGWKKILTFVLLTICIWTVDALSTYLVARSFNIDFNLSYAFILLVALGLSSAIPSTPGYIGVYQFVAVTVLAPFQYTRDQALVIVIGLQAVNFLFILLIGLVSIYYFGGIQILRRLSIHEIVEDNQ